MLLNILFVRGHQIQLYVDKACRFLHICVPKTPPAFLAPSVFVSFWSECAQIYFFSPAEKIKFLFTHEFSWIFSGQFSDQNLPTIKSSLLSLTRSDVFGSFHKYKTLEMIFDEVGATEIVLLCVSSCLISLENIKSPSSPQVSVWINLVSVTEDL